MGIFSFFAKWKEKRAKKALPAAASASAAATAPVRAQGTEQRKYLFEAAKTLTERSYPGPYLFVAPAQVLVLAFDEEEARQKAAAKLKKAWQGTGVELGELKLVRSDALPVDWSYGYGADRKCGSNISDLVGQSEIR